MLRSTTVLALVGVALLVCTIPAAASTLPPWERGEPRTTYQTWSFRSVSLLPDQEQNPYGMPVWSGPTTWLSAYEGRTGIGVVTGGANVRIPNAVGGVSKTVFLDLIWTGATPTIMTDPLTASSTVTHENLPDGWTHSLWEIHFTPNPSQELIQIGGQGTKYLDEVTIDTKCFVPEPSGILSLCGGLLPLLGLALRKGR